MAHGLRDFIFILSTVTEALYCIHKQSEKPVSVTETE